jgi:P4 family phage/plasmid primase-like protien
LKKILSQNRSYAKVVKLLLGLPKEQLEFLEETGILKRISREQPQPWTRHGINEFQGHIERYPGVFMERKDFNPNIEWMAFNNCMVNLLTHETSPFSHTFLNTTKIPVTYTGDAYATGPVADFWNWVKDYAIPTGPCPKIRKFLYEIMAPEDVELVLDFIAYCQWRDFPYHKWLVFLGGGSNGKGTFLTLVRRFLGIKNVSGESLQRLLDNKWAVAQLYGKLANIDADISNEGPKNTGLLKKLSGNDPIPAENKFQDPFWFVNHAKLILSANEIPPTPDETDAFYRRPIIINMIEQFLDEDDEQIGAHKRKTMDTELIDKLTTEEELSGLLYLLLERLPRVIQEGKRLRTSSKSIAITREKYSQGMDQIKAFINRCIEYGADENTPKLKVYNAYEAYCKFHRLTPETESSFSGKLKKDYHFEDKQRLTEDDKQGTLDWGYVKEEDKEQEQRQGQWQEQEQNQSQSQST